MIWTTSNGPYEFWQRYLEVFDDVLVISRIEPVAERQLPWKQVTGPGVAVLGLPNYLGPWGFVKTYGRARNLVNRSIRSDDAAILRIPNHVATAVEAAFRRLRRPYGVEMTGNPFDAWSPGAIRHPLRPILRLNSIYKVRRQCRDACAISYVTEYTLQALFPPSPDAYVTHYSSIGLPDQSILSSSKSFRSRESERTLVAVGSMALAYKGFDVLIAAVRRCLREGLDLRLVLVGDGRYRGKLAALAADEGDRIQFTGELPGSVAVRQELLKADVLVHPSKNEGLPRAIIEAMAVGLPCIGTSVGGTSELLPAHDIVPPGDVSALASKIREVVTNPERMKAMSARNLEAARHYSNSELSKRRTAMYRHLRQATEKAVKIS